ncbi:MAG TPA: aromatic-ring-hydroxylating dioxygenase subunit beta [Candidatus Binataceae bacterium]|nr:aromatic-ring-hydroxylating dioxygenase subunit beta [Candidatus Binataceae bacterium]
MARAQHDLALRYEIEDLYTEYAHALDNYELERWPEFFIDDCLYEIVSRENHERGLPLALMRCESKAMLTDRVVTIRQTQMFAPRALRHLISSIRIAPAAADGINAEANYAVLQTLVDDETRILSAGRYIDILLRDGDELKFKSRTCLYDTVMVPNSLIYPL